eukprot:tig00021491_g21766.t1
MRRSLRDEVFGRPPRVPPAPAPRACSRLLVRSLEEIEALDACQLEDGLRRGLVVGPALLGGEGQAGPLFSPRARRRLVFESGAEMAEAIQAALARARPFGAGAARLRIVALDGSRDLDEGPDGGLEEEPRPATAGLSPDQIARREARWRPRAGAAPPQAIPCAICREEVAVGEGAAGRPAGPALELPCGHAYHAPCLRRWLAVSGICPVCRSAP